MDLCFEFIAALAVIGVLLRFFTSVGVLHDSFLALGDSARKMYRVEFFEDYLRVYFPSSHAYNEMYNVPGSELAHSSRHEAYWQIPRRELALEELQSILRHHDQFSSSWGRLRAALDACRAAGDFQEQLSIATDSRCVPGAARQAYTQLNGQLRSFQEAGTFFIQQNQRVLVADDMGLGKTIEAIAAVACTAEIQRAVIVVPASVELNWCKEFRWWAPQLRVSLLRNRKRPVSVVLPDFTSESIPVNDLSADIVVLSYDALVRKIDLLCAQGFDCAVFDESQKLKNLETQRTAAAMRLSSPMKYTVLLSGTPILNRQMELFAQLKILRRLGDFGGADAFVNRYCGALGDLDELHRQLRRSGVFLRRTKDQVLSDLPEKQRVVIPIELPTQARKAYDEAVCDYVNWVLQTQGAEKAMAAKRGQQLARMNGLRRLAAKAKLDAVKAWVEEFLGSGEKLVLFGCHTEEIEALAKLFDAPTITGSTLVPQRQAAVDRFQSDPGCRLIVGNIEAMGSGHTLTAASNVAFFELGWNPSAHDQAEDRCYRIGQENAVTCWYLLAQDTIDMKIANLIESKRGAIDNAVDGTPEQMASQINLLGEI